MQIKTPYLLFLGDVADQLAAKTAHGIVDWRFSDQGDRVVRGFGQCSESISSIDASNQVPGRWYGGAVRSVPAIGAVGLVILIASMLLLVRIRGLRA